MLEALSDDAERKRLHLRDSRLCAVAIGQNARQLQYFGQPAAEVFSLSFNLEGDQVPSTSDWIVRCRGGFREIQLTTRRSSALSAARATHGAATRRHGRRLERIVSHHADSIAEAPQTAPD